MSQDVAVTEKKLETDNVFHEIPVLCLFQLKHSNCPYKVSSKELHVYTKWELGKGMNVIIRVKNP